MKILHITQCLYEGGVTNVVINIIKAFSKIGVENIIIAPDVAEEMLRQLKRYTSSVYLIGCSVKPIDSFKYILTKWGLVEEIVQHENPDAIMIQPGWLSLFSHFLSSIPTVVVVHGTYLNEIKYMWFHPLKGVEKVRYTMGILLSQAIETFQLKLASSKKDTTIVAVSRSAKEELIRLGISQDKVVSIINGVNKDIFKPMNKDHARSLVEELFKVKLRNKVLLHVNPGPRKGTHILIKAIALLKKVYGDDFTLLIAGRLGPRTYREYIENMIKQLKLVNNVKLLGYVKRENLPLLYNAADLTVVPSYSEGGPLIVPESLACGTPVIATNVGGSPEYLEIVGLRDWVIEIHHYDFSKELALKIYKLLIYCERNSSNNFHYQIQGWNDIASTYLNLFKKING